MRISLEVLSGSKQTILTSDNRFYTVVRPPTSKSRSTQNVEAAEPETWQQVTRELGQQQHMSDLHSGSDSGGPFFTFLFSPTVQVLSPWPHSVCEQLQNATPQPVLLTYPSTHYVDPRSGFLHFLA